MCMLDTVLNLLILDLPILFQLNLHPNIITCSFKIITHMLFQLSEQSKNTGTESIGIYVLLKGVAVFYL